MQPQSRVVIVMRHAKAEQTGPTDLERQLSPQGREDAAAAGAWLAGAGIVPDAALVSAAERTRQTWAEVARAAGWAVEASFDRGLYTAGPETALDLMRATPDDAGCLFLVGHNQTVASLAAMLDNGEGDDDAANEMTTGFPASAVAVLEYDGAWADLGRESARVVAFHAVLH